MRYSSTRALAALLALPAAAMAQNTTSTVVGVVTDASGAILPNTAVTLTNPTTGAIYKAKTNSAGSYRFGEVNPGPNYVLTFSHEGFSDYVVKGVYVNVGNSRTQDAKLSAGTSTTLEVNASGEGVTINTEDASIGNNVQVEQLNELPVQSRSSPSVLFTLQPGVANGSVTGARTDQTNVTVDGLDVNDFATGNFGAITGNAPVDSVQEFRGTVGGFQTNSGQGGGGQFQLITKSGTNHFHGNINEYHRDNSTVANSWFNDDATPVVRPAKLVRNQFGGNLGGPVLHDKLFFFVNVFESRIAQQANVERTVPIPQFVTGSINYRNNSQTGTTCSAARLNTNATCISTLTPAQVIALDPQHKGLSPAVDALLKLYPAPNDVTGGDGVNSEGYRFNSDNNDNASTYTGKLDYQLSSKFHIAGVGTFSRENSVNGAYAQFPGLPNAGGFVDRSYRYSVFLDWQISASKFNRVSYGSVVQDYNFPRATNPLGANQIGFSSGAQAALFDTPYSSPSNAQFRHIPIPQVTDDFTWAVGRHNINIGGFYKWINSSSGTYLDYNSYNIGLGGEVLGFANPSSLRPSNIYNGSSSRSLYDEALAVSLGRVGGYSSTFNFDNAGNAQPQGSVASRDYNYKQGMIYVGDTWKVTPNLTLNYGANYQLYSVPYEKNGLETVQSTTFNSYLAARVAQSAAGNSTVNSLPFFTYVLGGKANNGPDYYKMAWNNIAPRVALAYSPDAKTVFNLGGGIEYDRTIISAIQYQLDQFNYIFSQPSNANYGNSATPDTSLSTDPRYDAPPAVAVPTTPKPPFTPYVSNGVPYGLQQSVFNEMVDPTYKTPYNITMNAGLQHEFPGSMVLRLNYMGRFGRRLLAQADSSQLVNFTDPVSGQDMNTAFTNLETQVRNGVATSAITPQPFFENIYSGGTGGSLAAPGRRTAAIASGLNTLLQRGDFADSVQELSFYKPGYNVGMADQFSENTMYTNKGFSNYHGLLFTLSQNMKHGLRYDVNYTWSHSTDNVSLIANGVAFGGYGFICDALHPRLCRGNSDFDTTSVFNTNFTYALPVGRGRSFFNTMPLWLSEVVGGWDVSGIINAQSGTAFGTVTEAFIAGYANNAPAIFNGNSALLARKVHKNADGSVNLYAAGTDAVNAFSAPVGLTFGSRNSLRGPKYFNFDAGLAKTVAIWPKENVNLKFRADAFNVLNHPNFNSPGNNSNYDDIQQPGNFGQITSVSTTATNTGARVVQLIMRLEF